MNNALTCAERMIPSASRRITGLKPAMTRTAQSAGRVVHLLCLACPGSKFNGTGMDGARSVRTRLWVIDEHLHISFHGRTTEGPRGNGSSPGNDVVRVERKCTYVGLMEVIRFQGNQ